MEKRIEKLIGKAGELVEALPYMQKFYGKTVVVKYGGNAMINEDLKNRVMEDITLLKYIGINPIVVHGGGPDISAALTQFGIQSEFINGFRVTDQETMRIAQMVLIGKTNKEIVSLLGTKGGKGMGISGIDGGLIQCKKCYTQVEGKDVDIGFVGEITEINGKVLADLTREDYIPVVAPIGVDEEGNSYNINADTVAGAIAEKLGAEKLILLTDIEGIKETADSEDIIPVLSRAEIYQMIEDEKIVGGIFHKVKFGIHGIEWGVFSFDIIVCRLQNFLLLEIFTDHGIGTMITR